MSQLAGHAAYAYVAMKPTGGRKIGVRQAQDLAALSDGLRMESLLLLKHWELPAWAARDNELTLKDQLALNEQLAQLLSRGVPLVEALEVAAGTVRPVAKGRIERMRELVAAGSNFADACVKVGGFDTVTVAVYRGAERTGDLAGAAAQMAEAIRRRLAVAGKAVTLMMYPVIVLSISVLVAVGMLIGVMPMLGENLRTMAEASNHQLPALSNMVFDLGTWMRANVVPLMVGVAVVLVALLVGKAIVANVARIAMRRLPIVGEVVLAQESARFFSVMAAMTRSGVPIGDALGVSNQAISHPQLRSQLERLRTRLVEGGLLRTLIEEVEALPLATRRLLVAAERSGDLESAFNTLARDMTDEVDKRSQRLLAVMEPLLIVVMFLIIGSFLSAVLLPILTISSQASGL